MLFYELKYWFIKAQNAFFMWEVWVSKKKLSDKRSEIDTVSFFLPRCTYVVASRSSLGMSASRFTFSAMYLPYLSCISRFILSLIFLTQVVYAFSAIISTAFWKNPSYPSNIKNTQIAIIKMYTKVIHECIRTNCGTQANKRIRQETSALIFLYLITITTII